MSIMSDLLTKESRLTEHNLVKLTRPLVCFLKCFVLLTTMRKSNKLHLRYCVLTGGKVIVLSVVEQTKNSTFLENSCTVRTLQSYYGFVFRRLWDSGRYFLYRERIKFKQILSKTQLASVFIRCMIYLLTRQLEYIIGFHFTFLLFKSGFLIYYVLKPAIWYNQLVILQGFF